MEQQTDVRALIDRGDTLLREERPAEAAVEYARAVQQEPSAVGGHVGLAEANLALGQYGIAQQAAHYVSQLAPGTADAALAEAILAVLDRRYDAALEALEREIEIDPTRAYTHALRAYVLRRLGRNYDAALADARAARLSGKRDWEALFPRAMAYAAPAPLPTPASAAPSTRPRGSADTYDGTPHRIAYGQQRTWQGNRTLVRLRLLFATTTVVTYTLMAINIAIYMLCAAVSLDFITPLGIRDNFLNACLSAGTNPVDCYRAGIPNPIYFYGSQIDQLIQGNPLESYRFLTSMFLHANIVHIGLNMLSLYFVGIITERLFGAGRFTLIYFLTGILASIVQFGADVLTNSPTLGVGASGAIFGIFGAFGAFILLRRRALGPAANGIIGQWVFLLILNLVFSFGGFSILGSGIAGFAHLGGLVAGLILGALLAPQVGRRR
jgi:membrane associated rhomboid family serine protease